MKKLILLIATLIFIGFTGKAQIDLKQGLIAYYPFNGNAHDESGNGHHGTVNGATLDTDRYGNPNFAYFFNGQGNSISVNDFSLPTSATTITCWVKPVIASGIQNFISKHTDAGNVEILIRSIEDKYAIEWTIGGSFFTLFDFSGKFIIDPDHPRFDFLVLVYDGQQARFYINNTLIESKSIVGQIANNNIPMVFGRYASQGIEEYFNGVLDEIRIYNRVLNDSEIKALYDDSTSLHEIVYGSVTDVEGNLYKTVQIGNQTWMAENLKTTRLKDGTLIPLVSDKNEWTSINSSAYCWYNNDSTNKKLYGALYNWYTINTAKLCPTSWHVPSKEEWIQLEDYMGGAAIAGGKLKESGTIHWELPNLGASDMYGFSAMPAGVRIMEDATYTGLGSHTYYWSSFSSDMSKAWALYLRHDAIDIAQHSNFERYEGLSVRCLKNYQDSTTQVDLKKGLVAFYPFNGNANDESGNGNNGVVRGATLTSDRFGSNNSSYYFDKNYSFIQLPNNVLNDLPNASISLWVYWKGERPSIIMAKQHDWVDSYYIFGIGIYNIGGGVDVGDTGRIYFRVKNSSQPLISNSILESNKWNHLVITIAQDLKLYINGILDAEISSSDFILPDDLNATSTTLGLWLQDIRYSGVMNGNLDDIRIYNRAISNEEINALYSENDTSVSGLTNIALNKPVTQSSTKYYGIAERAVDGNTDGIWVNKSVTHSNSDPNAWLEIDLGGIYNISTIELWNRTDCCMSRLSDFYVFASNEPFVSKKLQNTLNQPGIWHIHKTGFPNPADTFRVDRTGRYIRIQLKYKGELSIAEVKVIGSLNPVLSNLALNKTVTQSSTQYYGVPERAVDGNTNGLWINGSVTHTKRDKNAWWEVDLGGVYDVSSIELWNRADNVCKTRLSDYYLFASEVPFGSKELNATLSQSNIWYDHQMEYPDPVKIFDLNRSVRYVRVQSADYTELNIAEVKVMGTANGTFKSTGERLMEEKAEISGITIYPVPFTEYINVKSEEIIDRIELYNVLGELLITRDFSNTNATLDTYFLEPGYYVIRIKTVKGMVKSYSVIKRSE